MPCGFQPVGRSGCTSRRGATSGRSHVWSAQKPFVLFPSVNLCAGAGGDNEFSWRELRRAILPTAVENRIVGRGIKNPSRLGTGWG
jgi:hypothetical protein